MQWIKYATPVRQEQVLLIGRPLHAPRRDTLHSAQDACALPSQVKVDELGGGPLQSFAEVNVRHGSEDRVAISEKSRE